MPKIVNKQQKRKEIALKAYELICAKGIKEFSTAALIKYMNVGKSSLYNYFKSRDEILHEVYFLSIDEYFTIIQEQIKPEQSLKEKLEIYFRFYLIDIIEYPHLKDLYKECMIIAIEDKTEQMIEANEKFLNEANSFLENLFKEEIQKETIKTEALNMVPFLQMNVDGIFMYSYGLKGFDIQRNVKNYIDSFIKLVEV